MTPERYSVILDGLGSCSPDLGDSLTPIAVMNYTEMEAKVRSYSPASSVPPRVPGLRTPCGRIP